LSGRFFTKLLLLAHTGLIRRGYNPFQAKGVKKMTKTWNLTVVFGTLFLATLACARTSAPTQAPSLPTGETTHRLTHAGLERSYTLYAPASVNWGQPIPLVFVFHGGTGNAESALRMSGFNQVADQHGFIVVYPNGTGRLSDDKLLTWNGGTCCAYAQEKNVDDVGFVRAIVAELQQQAAIDSKRIYATGLSNGAILSQRLACEAADVFAAIAPVAGTLNFSPCNPSQPMSVIEFHGTADQHIPYEGGKGPESLVDVDFASVPASVGFWTTLDGCKPQPQTDSFNDIQHETWTGCVGSTSVELYTISGGGHAWPGGTSGWPGSDQPTPTISASELIWDFFAAHPKP
jgi:polyhydroxybutyrate depolymerase